MYAALSRAPTDACGDVPDTTLVAQMADQSAGRGSAGLREQSANMRRQLEPLARFCDVGVG
jgi:hypothetical protein